MHIQYLPKSHKLPLYFLSGIKLALEINQSCGPTLKEFKTKVNEDPEVRKKIAVLKEEVETFALQFPMPGFEAW